MDGHPQDDPQPGVRTGRRGAGWGALAEPQLLVPMLPDAVVVSTTDTSSASEDEGPARRPGRLAAAPPQSRSSLGPRLSPAGPGSSTSSSASSTSSQPGGRLASALAGPAALGHVGQYRLPRPCTGAPRPSGPTCRLLGHSCGSCSAVVWPPQTLWRVASPRDADKGTVSVGVPPPALEAGLARVAGAGGRPLRCGCACSCCMPLAHSLDIVPAFGSDSFPCAWLARVGPGLQPSGHLSLQTRLNSPSP